jgi:hypothetical protein
MHKHHIIPKHKGGSDDPSNLIEVTVEEHTELHKQLWLEEGRHQDFLAWQGLAGLMPKEEIVRQLISNTHRGKKKSREHVEKVAAANRGRKMSEEAKLKIGRASLGRTWSDDAKYKKSQSMLGNTHRKGGAPTLGFTGRTHSEETKQKMRLSQKARRTLERT